jgi:hypothetical protein
MGTNGDASKEIGRLVGINGANPVCLGAVVINL